MLFTTPEQFVIVAGLLIGGWLLGYASAPGARKWKRRVRQQSDSFTACYGDVEEKLRVANQRVAELKAQADALRADTATAERTIADLRAAADKTPVPVPPLVAVEAPTATPQEVPAAVPVEPHAATAADAVVRAEPVAASPAPIGPAEPAMPSNGWFAGSARDDLTRIRGIDSVLNTRLFGLGVTHFADIEKLSAEDEMALEQRLALPVGYVGREQWRTQAALLRAGKDGEHATHFGAVEA